jgi:ankyrin repeat protein
VVERLLEAGAEAEAKDKAGRTAIHVALEHNHWPVVEHLCERCDRCGNLEARDEHGQTALFLASWKGRARAVERLLCAGADPNASDKTGETALHMASQFGHVAVVKALEVGGGRFRAKHVWIRRRGVTLWRIAVNFDQLG